MEMWFERVLKEDVWLRYPRHKQSEMGELFLLKLPRSDPQT